MKKTEILFREFLRFFHYKYIWKNIELGFKYLKLVEDMATFKNKSINKTIKEIINGISPIL